VSDLTWLAVAFFAVWVGIGAYVASLGIRQRNLERRLEDLEHD
jgi:CcmD family protein